MQELLLVEVFGQSDPVDLRLLLEVLRKDDLVDGGPVLWLLLQALADYPAEVKRDALRNQFVPLCANFLLEFLHVLGVVGVLVRAHLIQEHAKSPYIGSLRLGTVLPQLGCQVVWSAHAIDFLVIDHLIFSLLSNAFKVTPSWVELHRLILELLDVSEVANLC